MVGKCSLEELNSISDVLIAGKSSSVLCKGKDHKEAFLYCSDRIVIGLFMDFVGKTK